MINLTQNLEAIIFSSGKEISKSDILSKLPDDVSRKDLDEAVSKLKRKYSGECGIILIELNGKLQFCSNSKYGDLVTDILQIVKQKELTKVLIEVLAIIAYRQPITKTEIQDVRKSNSDYAMYMLQKGDMIRPYRHRNTPGRPIEYITTDEFLRRFQLSSLQDLPDYDEVMKYLEEKGNFNAMSESLYSEREIADDFNDEQVVATSSYKNTPTVSEILESVMNNTNKEKLPQTEEVDEEGNEVVEFSSDDIPEAAADTFVDELASDEEIDDDELPI